MTTLNVTDGAKMLRETLCAASALVAQNVDGRRDEHLARLQRLIAECDRHRPLGPNGKHGDRHTFTCGCEAIAAPREPVWEYGFVAPVPTLWYVTTNELLVDTMSAARPNDVLYRRMHTDWTSAHQTPEDDL